MPAHAFRANREFRRSTGYRAVWAAKGPRNPPGGGPLASQLSAYPVSRGLRRRATPYAAQSRRSVELRRPGAPERGVLAVGLAHELVVGAELHDPSVDDHRDSGRVVGGVQPVGDRDDRTALEKGVHRPLEGAGGALVDQR